MFIAVLGLLRAGEGGYLLYQEVQIFLNICDAHLRCTSGSLCSHIIEVLPDFLNSVFRSTCLRGIWRQWWRRRGLCGWDGAGKPSVIFIGAS